MLSPNELKIISMVVIGFGSFFIGVLPVCFLRRGREIRKRLVLSTLLCFGAGVLFATSILHILPEIRTPLKSNAELVFCAGFFILYFVDEAVHFFWSEKDNRSHQSHSHHHHEKETRTISQSGLADNSRRRAFTRSISYQDHLQGPYETNFRATTTNSVEAAVTAGFEEQLMENYSPAPCCNEEATFLCHGTHTEPCNESSFTGLVGLLIALTTHAILEGLAVGLQTKSNEVIILVIAISSHKFVVGFCLGLELARASISIRKYMVAMVFFAAGSAIGIGLGMLIFHLQHPLTESATPVLQGIAGGTLLYVTVSEVLPREKARWHRSPRRTAGVAQFFAVFVGFIFIYLLSKFITSSLQHMVTRLP